MKTIISKFMIIIFLFNLILSVSVYAEDNITIYNCGKAVTLSMGLSEFYGKKYVHENDLSRLKLKRISTNEISDFSQRVSMRLYPGSSIVVVDDITVTYPNSTVEDGEYLYINLDLIAMFFSKIYEVTDTEINLWISDDKYDFAKGCISLPDGETAPPGGISAEVFVARIPTGSSSGGGASGGKISDSEIGSPGFDNSEEKPMYDEVTNKDSAFLDYARVKSKTVFIPEGKSGVEYTLSADKEGFYRRLVGVYAEIDGRKMYGKLKYINSDEMYNFTLTKKPTINGTIEIPDIAENDIQFRVIAHGQSDFVYTGTIPVGENKATYSVEVDKNETYSIEVIFLDGEYLRAYYESNTKVFEADIDNISFVVKKSNEYRVNISLPDGFELDSEQDMLISVYLQTASSPHYISDTKQVTLDRNKRNAEAVLYDDTGSESVICYYRISGGCSGLFEYGHYSKSGTSFDVNNADMLTKDNSKIDMTLLKSKEINVNFSLPASECAEKDIEIKIKPVIVSYLSDSGNMEVVTPIKGDDDGDDVSKIEYFKACGDNAAIDNAINSTVITPENAANLPETDPSDISGVIEMPYSDTDIKPTVAKGESTGNETVSLPDEDGYKYVLQINVSGGASRYYNKIYYNSERSTAALNKATKIDNKIADVKVELIKQYCVSGNVNAVGFNSSQNRITAAAQNSEAKINDINECDFSAHTEFYGNGEYKLYVPAEFDMYILNLCSPETNGSVYYRPNECADDVNEAEIVTINDDTAGIDFVYSGYNPSMPLLVTVTQESENNKAFNINLKNISDFKTNVIDIYIGFYDEHESLTKLFKSRAGVVNARSSADKQIILPNDCEKYGENIKVMVWDNNMKPMAGAVKPDITYTNYSN